VIEYDPTGLDAVAVVEQLAEPETTEEFSPSTKPVIV
jgi:hypothetical protein